MNASKIMELLKAAYAAELETVENFLASSVWLDGPGSRSVAESLDGYITQKLLHAKKIAARLKELGITSPALFHIEPMQKVLQPPEDTDPLAVVESVLEAERYIIRVYEKLIEVCERRDITTEDLAVEILAAEEKHRSHFEGFLIHLNEERKSKLLKP